MNPMSIRSLFVLHAVCWLIIPAIGMAAAPDPSLAPAGNGHLLFASGFENDFRVDVVRHNGAGHWFPRPVGLDKSTGYRWPDDALPGAGGGRFNLSVLSENPEKYATVTAELTDGPHGTETRALRMRVIEDDPKTGSGTRVGYSQHVPEQMYSRYWLRLPANLHEIMNRKGDWWLISEWRGGRGKDNEHKGDHRLSINMEYSEENGGVTWLCHTQQRVQKDGQWKWVKLWEEVSAVRPVAGRWFLYELYYRRHRTEGRVWIAMDGQVVCDYTGRTMTDQPLSGFELMKCYPGRRLYKDKPQTVEQWIDDVQIWSDFPPRTGPITPTRLPAPAEAE
ncbi:MAG: hypothetical protein JXR37_14950 [Kiritimatiellae bacterium]|nr:hypothetical protein [Kiritimatiellia bacterium]